MVIIPKVNAYVQARVGGLEAFALDVEIPHRYGVNQCVGDTICAGGIMYGQRTIPVIMGICSGDYGYLLR